MTKKDHNKRKIIIEDKRGKEDPPSLSDQLAQSGQDLLSEMQSSASDAFGAVDDALSGFSETAKETAGKAETAEEQGRQGRENQPEQAEQPEQPAELTAEDLAARHLELAQRKEAELQNLRKRMAKDKEDARRFAIEGLLFDLFPVLDGLSQAAHTYKDVPAGENSLLDGVRSTIRSLEEALKRHGIEKISESGVPFDPNLHQPLTVEEADGAERETVAEVYTEGFCYGDKVLKPAMVRVVKPK